MSDLELSYSSPAVDIADEEEPVSPSAQASPSAKSLSPTPSSPATKPNPRNIKRKAAINSASSAASSSVLFGEDQAGSTTKKSSLKKVGGSKRTLKSKREIEGTTSKSLLAGVGLAGLKEAFAKASWGIAIAKAFAPKMELDRRNRVRVGVRFRPLSTGEKAKGDEERLSSYLELEEATSMVTITNPKPPPGQDARTDYYAYDSLYAPTASTEKVFEDLALPLVQYLIAGFNGTIFAYGQTGSGKTHSIMGNAADPGIVPRCGDALMSLLSSLDSSQGSFILKCSYLQIYREVLHDLLSTRGLGEAAAADRDHKSDLKIRRGKTGIYVENLVQSPLTSAKQLQELIENGNKKRATSATLMNAASSRSHAVVVLSLERHEKATATKAAADLYSKLHLVDLAGSERVAKSGVDGDALKEAIAINQSLSMLGTVINALTDQKSHTHIPYRSSKLTYLLEDSLGGNSHTVMLGACSPSLRSYHETMNTLQYAARAKLIVCEPRANIEGGEETEGAEDDAGDGRKSGKEKKGPTGPKDWDHLPRYIRMMGIHGPRRGWMTGEEKREAVLGVVGGTPPRSANAGEALHA